LVGEAFTEGEPGTGADAASAKRKPKRVKNDRRREIKPAAACPAGASRVKLRPRAAALDPPDRRGGRPRSVMKDWK
jgi:hypothetical protein